MLPFQLLLTGSALLVAVVALLKARRVSRRLERLAETYWELRYEHSQLRARVARLDPDAAAPSSPTASAANSSNFIPLSSLKR